MAMLRQTNFASGELSPLLWGRTDLANFAKGLRTCRNFFISKQGNAVSRPGSMFLAEVNATEFSTTEVRLIPFAAGDGVNYVIEVGAGYMRFYALGAPVMLSPDAPYTITTPYNPTDVWALKYAQTGDVLTITCSNHDPYELTLTAPTAWTLTLVDFSRLDTAVPVTFAPPPSPAATLELEVVVDMTTIPTPDTDHPPREWQWAYSVLLRNSATGAVVESISKPVLNGYTGGGPIAPTYEPLSTGLPGNVVALYPDLPVTLNVVLTAQGTLNYSGYTFVGMNIYRGRAGVFGWIGQTTSGSFVDVGDEPNFAMQPPQGTFPFGTNTQTVNGVTMHVERPLTVGFFQERRLFGGTTLSGDRIRASATGDYFDFDPHLVQDVSGEALDITIASRKREEINGLVARQRLLIFTGTSVWSLGGTEGGVLDFDNIDARVEDETGSQGLQPIVCDGAVLFVRAKGVGVRALVSQGQQYSYTGQDISSVAQHLFTGNDGDIVDWTYAQDPWGIVWAVRSDGALLSLAFDGQTWGWAHHDTDGLYLSVCSIPEGNEDAVYAIVQRTVNGGATYYVERFTSRLTRYPTGSPTYPLLYPDAVCLDAAFEYIGDPTVTFTGLDHLEGQTVYVIARGLPPSAPFVVTDGTITGVYDAEPPTNALDASSRPVFVAYVGLAYTCDIETLDVAAGDSRLARKVTTRVGFEVDSAVGLSFGQDFDHLEDWVQRDVDDAFNGVSAASALVDVSVSGTVDQSARAALRQSQPTPVTVLGITREVDVGG